MLKQKPVVLAVLLAASGALMGCGLSNSGDDDDSAGTTGGTSSSTGGAAVGFGGSSSTPTGGTMSSLTGGTGPVGLGGSTSTGTGGVIGTAGNGVFDGGSVPITQTQIDEIGKQACAGFLTEGATLPSVLELVIDVSSSMKDRAPGTNLSKWDVTRDALLEAIVGVNGPGLSPSIAVGLLFYPNTAYTVSTEPQDITACVNTSAMVPINTLGPPGAAQRTLIGNAIAQAQLLLSTPTHDAYRYALNEGLLPSTAPGKKFMLLITDGTPTVSLQCLNAQNRVTSVDPQPIVEEITNAAREEIKTFLIGSPGSEDNRTWMSTAAVIGGTAVAGCNVNGPNYCHMDMTNAPDFSAALRAGLARVVGQITPCTFTLADPPPGEVLDQSKINIIVSSGAQHSLIVRDDVGDCSQGWQLTADKEILLCPDTCSQVKSDANAKVNVLFGCGSLMEPDIR
jgi:hypothetical protein